MGSNVDSVYYELPLGVIFNKKYGDSETVDIPQLTEDEMRERRSKHAQALKENHTGDTDRYDDYQKHVDTWVSTMESGWAKFQEIVSVCPPVPKICVIDPARIVQDKRTGSFYISTSTQRKTSAKTQPKAATHEAKVKKEAPTTTTGHHETGKVCVDFFHGLYKAPHIVYAILPEIGAKIPIA